jgi:probable phosphoglycerate mutase
MGVFFLILKGFIMPIFLLIRHGQTDYVDEALAGRIDAPLTAYGYQQAQHLAVVLREQPVRAIYCSPMCRAVQTAQPLAEALHLFVEMDPTMTQVDFGEWQGLSFDELQNREDWQAFKKDPSSVGCPGGERMLAVRQRVMLGLQRIASGYENDDVVAIFSHGSIIRQAIALFLDMPLHAMNRLKVETASVSTLYVQDGTARLIRLNQVYPPQ